MKKFIYAVALFLFVVICQPLEAFELASFSSLAREKIKPIYREILHHPFNQELKDGTLSKDKFDFYKRQDAIYLKAFAKSLTILATKMDDPVDSQKILKLALACLQEGSIVDGYKPDLEKEAMPATVFYTSYLLNVAAYKSREELAAALLPCFWIYLLVAEDLRGHISVDNPYAAWFREYSSDSYREAVRTMIDLTDRLAAKLDPQGRHKMMEAFVMASRLEWLFWEDAYKKASFWPAL